MSTNDDDGFRGFADSLAQAIDRYKLGKLNGRDLLLKQAQQFTDLIRMETEFRETLVESRYGGPTYRAFIEKICETNGNILTSRPYFRERQAVCIGDISKALKKREFQALYRFHFNYNFVAFVMKTRVWPKKSRQALLAKGISNLRKEIVELNMPLAISQARMFWQKAPVKTQDTRFTFNDFVNTAADGLISAIDKFVPPPDLALFPAKIKAWRGVAIGRMLGNFIEMFSETSIHFYPTDKRKLYRANKHVRDFPGAIDFDRLAEKVNSDLGENGPKTTGAELQSLMGAASSRTGTGMVVGGEENEDDSGTTALDQARATDDWEPDTRYERKELLGTVKQTLVSLDMVSQKLIRMRGVDLAQFDVMH